MGKQTLWDVVRKTKQFSQNSVSPTHKLQEKLSGTVSLCKKVHGLLPCCLGLSVRLPTFNRSVTKKKGFLKKTKKTKRKKKKKLFVDCGICYGIEQIKLCCFFIPTID